MKGLQKTAGLACTASLLLGATALPLVMATSPASAQAITASIEGTVLQPNGQPAAGARATVIDSRDGRSQSTTADERGIINFRSIGAGGPYTVRITTDSYEDLVITDLYTDVAGTSSFTVTLEAESSIEEIVVTAAQIQTITTASGPSSSFSFEQISDLPSTTRQIRDVIRIDPRVSIGETGDGGDQSGAISCLGGSSRTNSFTIDGVRATDAFGLNLSGNLARFTFPIPFDTVAAAAVEFSPVSVEYGQFSGCNVNVVTKSGENEFHGGAFYLFNDDSLTGDEIGGDAFDQGTFERKNWGVEFSGPILRDKLFFYASYEEFDTATVNQVGAADDTSFPQNDTEFTLAEVNRIRDILRNQYGRDPGEIIRNLPVVSERFFGRVDWNINDSHRVEATYATLKETTTIGDDIGSGRGEFTFADNFHLRGSDSDTFALRLYSDWTDNFSTEVRWSTQEVTDQQNPLGGGEAQDPTPIPRIAISDGNTAAVFGGEFFGQEFVSGPGTFRSANSLATEKDQFRIKADYQLGDHLITGGWELEQLDVFNLFIINATGTVFFDSIDSLEAGTAFEIRQGVSFTQDPNDAAAIYSRDINSFFLQDTWDISDTMQLIFGVRYDYYSSDDLPLLNQNYVDRYGFTNQVSYDELDAIQPRIGLNWTLPEDTWGDTRISLGFGVFSGNDPTVWFSNAYQNFGGALGVGAASASCDPGDLQVLQGGTFTGIPACVTLAGQGQAQQTAGAVNATDPNLDLPTVNRFSFGVEHNTDLESSFFSDWLVQLDVIYADLKDQVAFLDLSLQENGTAPDGRPIYVQVDPLLPGCNASFNGLRQGFSNVTPECFGGNQDIFFTNQPGDGGSTFTTSLQLAKTWEFGADWQLSTNFGYSYNDSDIGNPGTSFTAAGNFRSVVTSDLQDIPIGASLRNTPHNFVLATTLSKDFFGDNRTSVTAFFQRRSGSPVSLVFTDDQFADAIGDTSGEARNLLYVPTGPNDPIVQFDPGFDQAAFFDFVDRRGLRRGAIQGKGTLDERWFSDLDIRIQQEIPFFRDSKAKIYIDIENVLNLIDDDLGRKTFINTDIASAVGVVDATIDPGTNTYLFESFNAPEALPDTFDSLWRLQLGIRADF